jgi:hypothetical protein
LQTLFHDLGPLDRREQLQWSGVVQLAQRSKSRVPRVGCQECEQQSGFVPVEVDLKQGGRVVVWKIKIVKVNLASLPKASQDLQDQAICLASLLYGISEINE